MATRFLAAVILVALLGSNCSRFFVFAGFELNQKYIAENLCVNKLRPNLHCNGRCYFMKKIKQAEEDDKKQARQDQKNRYEEALPVTQTVRKSAFVESEEKTTYPRAVAQQPVARSYAILQPPKIA